MTETNSEPIIGTIAIIVHPQDNGQYVCLMSPSLGDSDQEPIRCYDLSQEQYMTNTNSLTLPPLKRGIPTSQTELAQPGFHQVE